MTKILEPIFFEQLETDVKKLIQSYQEVKDENARLLEQYTTLQHKYQALQQGQLRAIQHAQAIVDELAVEKAGVDDAAFI
ncbi:MAG: hypothetical protein K2Q14_06015 [Gammaproteobacteria bacterium]|nr:hypothetical protein [Gammaproteobacteria bacterium]